MNDDGYYAMEAQADTDREEYLFSEVRSAKDQLAQVREQARQNAALIVADYRRRHPEVAAAASDRVVKALAAIEAAGRRPE